MARKHGKDRGLVERPKGSGIWWVRAIVAGRDRMFKVGAKSAARTFYGKLKTEAREGRLLPDAYARRSVPLAAVLDGYLATCTKRTIREDRRFVAFWKAAFPDRPLDTITADEVERVRMDLLGAEKTPATCNRYVAFLKHVYNVAKARHQVRENPVVQVKLFKEPRGRVRFLTQAETARLQEVMTPDRWALVAFALQTGLRRGEQFSLRWDHVDLDNRVVTIPRSKSGYTRHVSLSDDAVTILRGLSSWMTSPWVFPSQNPATALDAAHVAARVFLPAVQAAGLQEVTWHTLRHTFASRLVMAGVDLRTVSELMGHQSIEMTMRYAHISNTHRLDAVNRLSQGPSKAISEKEPGPKPGPDQVTVEGMTAQLLDK